VAGRNGEDDQLGAAMREPGRNGDGEGGPLSGSGVYVRREKVARLRREVADGSYRVDARAVAARMLPVLLSNPVSAL